MPYKTQVFEDTLLSCLQQGMETGLAEMVVIHEGELSIKKITWGYKANGWHLDW
jgi:hypothetical protein